MAKNINVLVTGGAGYIGSHTCLELSKNGFNPVTYDNLSTGRKSFVKWGPLVKGDLLDKNKIIKTIDKFKIDSVIHLAAKSQVEESELKKKLYFENNVLGTITLLEAMVECNLDKIIFSSTAAVYGNNSNKSLKEIDKISPINMYGLTKYLCETVLLSYSKSSKVNFIALRYFNASGSDYNSKIGELHFPETHLMPRVCQKLINNQTINIYGNDYETKDGTCVRDFIHVRDIASAHIVSLKTVMKKKVNKTYNIGTGKGYSVLQVVKLFENKLGKKGKISFSKKRDYDPQYLVANASLFSKIFKWKAKYSSINNIIKSEIEWRKLIQ